MTSRGLMIGAKAAMRTYASSTSKPIVPDLLRDISLKTSTVFDSPDL